MAGRPVRKPGKSQIRRPIRVRAPLAPAAHCSDEIKIAVRRPAARRDDLELRPRTSLERGSVSQSTRGKFDVDPDRVVGAR